MDKIEYENYKNMIYKQAYKIHCISGKDKDDLISQGNLIFCECLNRYKEEKKVSFGTYLFLNLYYGLFRYVKSLEEYPQVDIDIGVTYNFEKVVEFKDELYNLSNKSKEIINLIFNFPEKVTGSFGNNSWKYKITKKSIYYFLINQNWGHTQIINAFKEIKNIL